MRPFLGCTVAFLIIVAVAAQDGRPDAADLTRRLQARYQSVHDFTADFDQTYEGVLHKKAAPEHGKLLLKKPSRVRMSYEKPKKKFFVSDGTQFYSYFPADRAGTVNALPKEGESS